MSQQFNNAQISLGVAIGRRVPVKNIPFIDFGACILTTGYETTNYKCARCTLPLKLSKYQGVNIVFGRKTKNGCRPHRAWCIRCLNKGINFKQKKPSNSDFIKLIKMIEAAS